MHSYYHHLLEYVKDSVCRTIELVVRLDVLLDHLSLSGQLAGLCDNLGDGLASHTTTLGSEIDTFTGAFRHIAGSVTDKGSTADDSSWSEVDCYIS